MLTWVLAGMMGVLVAGDFAMPAEGPVPFRRDRIPMDVDAISILSQQLCELARGMGSKTAEDRHGAAQMLALALALDPANRKARNVLEDYRADQHQPKGDEASLELCRARIWQSISWLQTPSAGTDGQALADCLKDVIVLVDPKHPKAEALRNAGPSGQWKGWVPDLAAYQKADPTRPAMPPKTVVDPPKTAARTVPLAYAQVFTPMWQAEGLAGQEKWNLIPGPLRMTARRTRDADDENASFSIVIGNSQGEGPLDHLAQFIKDLLSKQHEALPKGVRVQITSKEFVASLRSGKRESISAAATVLASAAVTGREPDAIIIGQIDDGQFKLPSRFWYQLRALGKGTGQRLVLPAAAAAYLPSLLAMEKPEFFLQYEVLLAADFNQLLELSAKTAEGPLAGATAKFHEIQSRAGALDVRSYITNSFVKQRLAAVLQDDPAHYSAKMLLIQASGDRPIYVSREVLAAELRRAMEPANDVLKAIGDYTETNNLAPLASQAYGACRAGVDALDRCVDRKDRELLDQTRDVLSALRNIDRAAHARSEYSYEVEEGVRKAGYNFKRVHADLLAKLGSVMGDPPPAPGG